MQRLALGQIGRAFQEQDALNQRAGVLALVLGFVDGFSASACRPMSAYISPWIQILIDSGQQARSSLRMSMIVLSPLMAFSAGSCRKRAGLQRRLVCPVAYCGAA